MNNLASKQMTNNIHVRYSYKQEYLQKIVQGRIRELNEVNR